MWKKAIQERTRAFDLAVGAAVHANAFPADVARVCAVTNVGVVGSNVAAFLSEPATVAISSSQAQLSHCQSNSRKKSLCHLHGMIIVIGCVECCSIFRTG